MKKLLLSCLSVATLSGSVVSQKAVSEPVLQYKSLAYRCAFHPHDFASLERTEFYARYLYKTESVSLEDFLDWFKKAYPGTTNHQCFPYEAVPITSPPAGMAVREESDPVVQSVIDYVFGAFPEGYNEEKQMLKQHAYGRQHQDSNGDIIAIGFTGQLIGANGITERRPVVWVVNLLKWGGDTLLWPCLTCIKELAPTIPARLWNAWQALIQKPLGKKIE